MNQLKSHHKAPFYRRKIFLWPVGIILGLVCLTLIAFRVSPWPGAMIIRWDFENNGAKTLKALEAHTPTQPVTVVSNRQYRPNDRKALMDIYYPESVKEGEKLPVVIWTHGGAWISGDKKDAAPYYKLLAAEGFTVIALDYSVGPESIYPAALYQLDDAYIDIQNNASKLHADTDNIILAGDSAGAQLSSQMAGMITNSQYATEVGLKPSLKPEQLKGVVLNCGIYNMKSLTTPNPTVPKIIGWGNDVSVWAYIGTRDFDNSPAIKQMSSINYVTSAYPAAYISGGNADPLTDAQSKPLADKLKSLDVNVETLFYAADHSPQLEHEYQFDLDNEDGENALAKTIEFVKSHTE
jgi:acetyl esterase